MAETDQKVILAKGLSSAIPSQIVPGKIHLETDTGTMNIDVDSSTRIQVKDNTKLPTSGGSLSGDVDMSNHRITGLGNPNLATDAATKQYVDTAISNIEGRILVQSSQPSDTSYICIDISEGGILKYWDSSSNSYKPIISVWG